MNTINAIDLLGTDDRRPVARDEMVVDKDALSLTRLEAMLADINRQPPWRIEADKACDYYDGNQLDGETLDRLREKGMGPLITNLIKPTIDAVLGLEAKTRTDWKVVADDERNVMVAEFLSQKLYEAEREARADRACSDAYAGQIKSGFAAVEVSRSTNPFDFQYRVKAINRREIWWDWRDGVSYDWSDCRWVLRKRWSDPDVLAAYFPKHADLIRYASKGWPADWQSTLLMNRHQYELLQSGVITESRTSIEEMEWRDTERERVMVFEVWYKTWHRGAVITLPTGRKIEYDPKNPQHVAVVAAGVAPIQVGVFDRLRVAYFVGPHRIADYPSNRRRFPYIPFWGYREDLTGAPYGLIRSMLSPQDEVNARRAKMMWLLSQKRVMIDSDALDQKHQTLSDASRELARADAFVVTNPNSVNKQNSIRIDENLELSQFQFRLLEEAMNAVQKAGGVYSVMLGQAQTGVTANSAMQTLIEQGTTTLAEINDNYAFGRRLVGESLLELIRDDIEGVEMQMLIDTGSAKKQIYVNRPAIDPTTGQQYRENDTAITPVKVQLEDVPSTPSYRAQQLLQLSEVTKSLGPELQAFVTPFLVEATDLPNRREIAALLRKQLGIAADPDTPEAQAAAAEAAQKQAVIEQLNMRQLAADVAEKEARAKKANAEAERTLAEMQAPQGQGDNGASQVAVARQQFENTLAEIKAQYRDQMLQLRTELARIRLEQSAKQAQAEADAEVRLEEAALELEKEREITKRDTEVARINAEAQKSADAVQAKIDQVANQYEQKLAALQQQIKDFQKDMKHKEELRKAEEDKEKAVEDAEEKAEKEVEALEAQAEEAEKRAEEAQKAAEEEKQRAAEAEKKAKDVEKAAKETKKPRKRKIAFKLDKSGNPIGAEVEEEGD